MMEKIRRPSYGRDVVCDDGSDAAPSSDDCPTWLQIQETFPAPQKTQSSGRDCRIPVLKLSRSPVPDQNQMAHQLPWHPAASQELMSPVEAPLSPPRPEPLVRHLEHVPIVPVVCSSFWSRDLILTDQSLDVLNVATSHQSGW